MSDRYGTSGGMRYVYASGEITGSATPTLGYGFRPHIAINVNTSGLDFTYTGDYRIRFEDGVVELLSSGEFKSLGNDSIDISVLAEVAAEEIALVLVEAVAEEQDILLHVLIINYSKYKN